MFFWSFLVSSFNFKNISFFLYSFQTKEYLLPHLTLKEGVGVSDSNVILTLSVVRGNLGMDGCHPLK